MNTDTSDYRPFEKILGSAQFERFLSLAEDYHRDPELREQVESDPKAVLAKYQVPFPPNIDVRIVANTDETFNLVMPPDPNIDLADENLMAVAAGGKSVGSAGTLGTFSSIASSASTASSVGSAGTAS